MQSFNCLEGRREINHGKREISYERVNQRDEYQHFEKEIRQERKYNEMKR